MTPAPFGQQRSTHGASRRSNLWPRFALVLAIAMTAQLIAVAASELQVAAAAFQLGENLWSKGRQRAVTALFEYGAQHDPAMLATARDELDVPLGDLDARHALDTRPFTAAMRARAEAGFLRGRVPQHHIGRVIRIYRWFGREPHVAKAIHAWRNTDADLLRLARMPDEYAAAVAAGDNVRIGALNRELAVLDQRMYEQQMVFVWAFQDASNWLNRALFAFTGIAFLLLSWGGLSAVGAMVRRIRASEGNFRSLFREAPIGIARIDADGRMHEVNQRLCDILGRDETALLDTPLPRMHGESWPPLAQLHRELMNAPHATLHREFRFHRNDGTLVHCKLTASPLAAEDGDGQRFWMLLLEDLSETARLKRALSYQSTHDALTGLLHRAEMRRVIGQLLLRVRREPGRHALLVMDLDRFRLVNETAGYACGDDLLTQVGQLLTSTLGPRRPVARLGGNQFAVLLENTVLTEAESIAASLRRTLRETDFASGDRHFKLTASFGIAKITDSVPDAGVALRCADIACDLAKQHGRNRVRVYSEQDAELAQHNEDIAWVDEIRGAIAAQRIYLDAQRIQPLDRNGGGAEFEVLVRLVDSNGRLHSPNAFIRVAERYDLIQELDNEVLRKTLQTLGADRAQLDAINLCHINVSAQSMTSAEFRGNVVALARHYGVPFRKLCFELTETAAITNLQEARTFIDQMRGLGCCIALDDFGSGMSSFAYLKTLPVDILKIDGMFVRNSAKDAADQSVLSAFAHIGRTLGKRTLAEWVEDDDVLTLLRLMGVNAAQGYAIERPQALEKWLHEQLPRTAGAV